MQPHYPYRNHSWNLLKWERTYFICCRYAIVLNLKVLSENNDTENETVDDSSSEDLENDAVSSYKHFTQDFLFTLYYL